MDNVDVQLGLHLLNIEPFEVNKEYIFNILTLKSRIKIVLERARRELNADFEKEFFINFFTFEKTFGVVKITSIEFQYKENFYKVCDFDNEISLYKIS